MPLFLQLQVWFCFSPFIAAVLLVPTLAGARPLLVAGNSAIYLSSTTAQTICTEESDRAPIIPGRNFVAKADYSRLLPSLTEEHRDLFVSLAKSPISPRAP